MSKTIRRFAALAAASAAISFARAQQSADEVVVQGRWDDPFGYSISASQGVVGADELDARPRLRTGEILEVVPGLIVTQHSGTGKSNQMFLRGFNLDHGTDFATWVDGMPVNMPTHGHGQGYTDVNFVIPELVERLEYRKGAYYAEVSDFSSAGAAYLTTYRRLDEGLIKAGLGEDGYVSALLADSFDARSGAVTFGVQAHRYDGPWVDVHENVQRNHALLRYSAEGSNHGQWDVAFMGYDAQWSSADQIPRRAVESGQISAFGSLDTSLGGTTSRYSASGSWSAELGAGRARGNAYTIDYDLNLFSNFTYFLDDPVDGDQFEQLDDRRVTGGDFAYSMGTPALQHTIGFMVRRDDIRDVGLFRTANLERLATVRRDSVDELALGVYYANEKRWTDRIRTTLGIRFDRFEFDVRSDRAQNSGAAGDSLVAPKLNLIYAASDTTELYLSAGKGFHSNDARGTTIAVDPVTGGPAERVSPLVAAQEFEVGFRSVVERRLNLSAALWYLELDSELVFIGDAGTTEPSRPSKRYGLELPLYYRATDRVTLDLELALTKSKFTELDPAGDDIPGSIDRVLAAGISYDRGDGFYGSARLRYFGPRPLIEDGSVESDASAVVNASVGFRRERYDLRIDLLNVFDSDDDDITYLYASRLPSEPAAGILDEHFHPLEPRTLRAYLSWKF